MTGPADVIDAGGEAEPTPAAPALDAAVDGYLDHLAVERGLARASVRAYAGDLVVFVRGLVARGVRDPVAIDTLAVRTHLGR